MRSNMTANAPHHLYKNLKFSELSEFSDVRNFPQMLITVYGSHTWATQELTCVHTVPSTFQKNQGVKNFTLVACQECCTLTVHGSHTLMKIATCDTHKPHVNLDSFTVNAAC